MIDCGFTTGPDVSFEETVVMRMMFNPDLKDIACTTEAELRVVFDSAWTAGATKAREK